MPDERVLDLICQAYDEEPYPQGFRESYTIMECLADRNGIDTFLVQDHEERRYIAKCYSKSIWAIANNGILDGLEHQGLPHQVASFEDEHMRILVREYVEGTSLDRYAEDNDLTERQIVDICLKLCDILSYLHHRSEPIIHRDIKPQNVIVKPDGTIALIDFDIARVFNDENDTDTVFFGTRSYAPPEQYGFSQTDARADIYSLGVLLRFLLTGSPRENKNVRVYRPLGKIIRTCTAFAPDERYSDVSLVARALKHANPTSQAFRFGAIAIGCLAIGALIVFGCVKVYEAATYSPFNRDHIPTVLDDEERVADAVSYLQEKYNTHLFDDVDSIATVGLLRTVLIDVYGYDHDYVYNSQKDGLPEESDEYFLAWGWDDGQNLNRDYATYAVVKAYDPSIVAEDQWSKLKDDTGEYPGTRVAVMFAEDTGILTGVGRPYDITVGELALLFANADRVFSNA